jgi:Protein of unknown function (DUF3780)
MMAATLPKDGKPVRKRAPKPSATIVDARPAIEAARKAARKADVVGFGCPAVDWPHHLKVVIPAGRGQLIRLVEDFGIIGHASGRPDEIERCVIGRSRWNAMAEIAKQDLNARLREKGLPTSRWQSGDNKVERILGTELLTLAWAVAAADEVDIAAIIATWVSLQSVERLWLAGRVLANPNDRVRQGLALLLSAGPRATTEWDSKSGPAQKGIGGLPLFEGS